jgi:CRP-like cAMP-binding protein
MIGASRETVSRTLRNLVEHGVIDVSRKEILLRDRATLAQAARRV